METSAESASAFRSSVARKPQAVVEKANEYLTFRLGGEEYGIDILRVQEIRSYELPTRLANAPSFVKGVINLRGVIVPIIDLRMKLGCDDIEDTPFTVVIVLNVKGTEIGAVVDAVSDVVGLTLSSIKPAPQFQGRVDSNFVTGIAKLGERMLVIMDIESLMSSDEMGLLLQVAQKA
jgi:purine-binding chemotaxis protein CheW